MTDKHEDLVIWLETYFANTGLTIGYRAATAIKELVARAERAEAEERGLRAAVAALMDRAEKAEEIADLSSGVIHKLKADLAAARKALNAMAVRWQIWDCLPEMKPYAAAIAAALAEGGKND